MVVASWLLACDLFRYDLYDRCSRTQTLAVYKIDAFNMSTLLSLRKPWENILSVEHTLKIKRSLQATSRGREIGLALARLATCS